VKHARAGNVWVSLREYGDAVTLEIRDDGVGFRPEEAPTLVQEGHLGLIAMRERVETIGGSWELQSSPGEGTVVRAIFREKPADPRPARAVL
jgi:signal transduction histidine kinase